MLQQTVLSTPHRTIAPAAAPPKPVSVQAVARECFASAKGDVHRAARIMEKRVHGDAELMVELSEEFIRMVCVEATGAVLRSERLATWLPPNYDAGGKGDRVSALSRGNAAMLMDFPLPGGKRLGEANADEVRVAADFYAKQAGNMAHKARWLSLIAGKVKDKTVKDTLTEKKLRELQKESDDE